MRCDVAIVGSGFAGSILARMLARRGRSVVLLDRERHPRFAIGESATPLAGLALERIAREYDLPDLADLATYGRWSKSLPGLRRGLKRGFSFYHHRAGHAYANGPENEARLLVAASPNDEVADSHWLRSDVDTHLASRAAEEGVLVWEGAAATRLAIEDDRVTIRGVRDEAPFRLGADFVVDATGSGALLADAALVPSRLNDVSVESGLVGTHFEGVRPFVEVAAAGGASFCEAPYPEERAAVHHLLEEGWMYVLPFDHGVVSAGIVVRGDAARPAGDPAARPALFRRILSRYPSLDEAFRDAAPVGPWLGTPRLQRRLARGAGARWLLLPHAYAFTDPLFSTGIAWSLFGVRRAAALLERGGPPDADALEAYDRSLAREADQIEGLIAGALRAAARFRLFVSWSFLYFATVAAAETRMRLGVDAPAELLASDRASSRRLLREARTALEEALAAGSASGCARFEAWVARRIADFDVAGFADPSRHNVYPVDLELLVERAPRLGLSAEEMRQALPRLLRGTDTGG